MKMLLGLTKPTSGEVKIWGKSLQGNEKKLLPRIGSLIESPGFYPNLTGTETVSYTHLDVYKRQIWCNPFYRR